MTGEFSTVVGVLESIMSSKPKCAPAGLWEAPIVVSLHEEQSKRPQKVGPDRSAAAAEPGNSAGTALPILRIAAADSDVRLIREFLRAERPFRRAKK